MLEYVIASSLTIAAVIGLRALFGKRVPSAVRYALWLVVAVRLLLPWGIWRLPIDMTSEAELTAVHSQSETIVPTVSEPVILTESEALSTVGNADEPNSLKEQIALTDAEFEAIDNTMTLQQCLNVIWLVGAVGTAAAMLWLNISMHSRLRRSRKALQCKETTLPVYLSEAMKVPCLFGVIKPVIYVTEQAANEPQQLGIVLKHEQTHYRHGDHIWGCVRCICLAVGWYNPLVWLAAVMSRQDSELACDEAVARVMNEHERREYCRVLLGAVANVNAGNVLCSASTMSGAGKALKERIERLTKESKRSRACVILLAVLAAAIAVCAFATADGKTEVVTSPSSLTSSSDCYEFEEVVYYTPLSSFYPFGGTGYLYFADENSLMVVNEASGEIVTICDNAKPAQFEPFDKNLLEAGTLMSEELTKRLKRCRSSEWIIYPNEYMLCRMDDELWLVQYNGGRLWSIIELKSKAQSRQETYGEIVTLTPPTDLNTQTPVGEGLRIDYANSETMVFHGEHGLFVYDIITERIDKAFDMKSALGLVEGESVSDIVVEVSEYGERIQFYRRAASGEPEYMYRYHVRADVVTKMPYSPIAEHFTALLSVEEATKQSEALSDRAESIVSVNGVKADGGIGALISADGTLGKLSYIWDSGYSGYGKPIFYGKLFNYFEAMQ